jgi:hypothetical protein
VHVDSDGAEEPSGPGEEAAAVPHGDGEGCAFDRLAERPVPADVGDERERSNDGSVAAERAVRPGDLLDHLRLAELDVHYAGEAATNRANKRTEERERESWTTLAS